MNIKELAKEAGLKRHQEQAPGIDGAVGSWDELAEFALLVAAHEREECAKVADKYAEGLERNYSEIIAEQIRARGKA